MNEIPLGLLGFAAGAMQAGRQSPTPLGFGEALGGALQGGLQNYGLLSQIQNQSQSNQYRQMAMMQDMARQQKQAEQEAARQGLLAQWTQTLPEDQRLLALAAPDSFIGAKVKSTFETPETTPLQRDLIAAGLKPGTPEYANAIMRNRMPAPKDAPEQYRMLTPEEARQHGLPPGSYQMSGRGQISRVGGDPVSRLTTADGRVIEIDESTGAVVDRTPPVSGFEPMAAPGGRAGITGETVQQGVGPGPFAASAIGTIFGGFIPEATDEQTERAKSQLSILERLTRGALTISARPSAWEQQQIQALFADPDSFFQSPGRAGIKLQELRNELVNVYNDNSRLLQSPAIQGAKRAELMQSNSDLQRAIDMVQINDADIQQLLGQQGQGGTTSSGVGWRIVN